MKTFSQFAAVFEAELKSYLREVGPLVFVAVFPLFFSTLTYGMGTVLTGEAAPERWLYQVIGFGVMTVSIVLTSSTAWYFRRGMSSGRLEYVMAAPVNPLVILTAHSLANVLTSLLAFVFTGLVATYIVYGLSKIPGFLLAAAVTFFALLPVVGVNLVVGVATIVAKEPEPVANTVAAVVAATSGFAYPITLLPPVLQLIGMILPFHHVVETARAAVMTSLSPTQLPILLLMMLYLVAGLTVYRYGENHYARKMGVSW